MKKLLLLFTLTVLPLVAWCADGDTFTANTVEGVAMTLRSQMKPISNVRLALVVMVLLLVL